jgi:hypothetical protein
MLKKHTMSHEDTGTRWPSASQGERPQKKSNL